MAGLAAGIGLHSIAAELLHSILASRDSLRCRDLGRLACACRLFTTAHIDAAAEAIVAHRSPAAQARIRHRRRPAGSQRRPGQRGLRALGTLEKLEDRMRGWTGSCVVGHDVRERRMCVFDAWVKQAETIPALTEMLGNIAGASGVTGVRSNFELIVGHTVLASERALKSFEELITRAASEGTGDDTSAFEFLVKFYHASIIQKEQTLLAPWLEKLNGYGSEVHITSRTHKTQHKPPPQQAWAVQQCRRLNRGVTARRSRGSATSRRRSSSPSC
jgi:hypothetical protein